MKKWLIGLACAGMWATAAMGSLTSPATLPMEYAGASGWSNATLDAMTGWDASGLGTPYAAPNASAKFDSAGDNIIIYFDAAPGDIVYSARRSDSGAMTNAFLAKLQESDNTNTWTDVCSFDGSEFTGTLVGFTNALSSASRYVKLVYVTKATGQNFGVGYVKITAAGSGSYGVTFNRTSGFSVEQGASTTIVATAVNGTAPYTYGWSSTLDGASYAASSNVFTILATAPTGSYSATVVATDDAAQQVTNSLNFSVVPATTKYPITITAATNGTVTTTPATEAAAGATVTITATPAGGYVVDTYSVVGADSTPIGTSSSFVMPAQGVTVTVTFKLFVSSPLYISEVADPGDNVTADPARFVELYNSGASNIDLAAGNWYLEKQVNGGTWYSLALTGSVAAGSTYVVAGDTNFAAHYPGAPAPNQISATQITGNGDDGYYLYKGGSHSAGSLEDAYGVFDQDGSSTPWEYTDARAVRNSGVTGGNPTWTASEWTIASADMADMTPGVHPDGSGVFGVSFNKSNGFTVDQGASDSVTATAANGTAPYAYAWSSTLDGAYYSTNDNVFTILATAPIGDYSATVLATDNAAHAASNTVTFSVTTPATKYAIAIVTNAPANGTVTTTPATEAAAGATVTITATPAGGYAVDTYSVVGADTTVIGTTSSFTMPAQAVTVTVTFKVQEAASGELIISQYYEGSGNNKWIEIYNPGATAVDLGAGNYRLGTWNNALREGWKTNATPTLAVALSNSLAPGATYLVSYTTVSNPAYATANQTANLQFNGDDSVAIYTGTTYDSANIVDVFGTTNNFAADKSYVRTNTVIAGVNTDFNAANWVQFTLSEVEAAGATANEYLGYHSTGAAVFGVSFNRTNGFTVEQGASGSVAATAVNGTLPYGYSWTSTLGEGYRTADSNVFTILATAPLGDYSATVVATDNAAQAVTNTVAFSVVVPPPKYAIAIVTNAPENGTVTTTPATEAAAGATVTVNATPVGGYAVDSIVVNGGAVAVNGTTFTMPSTAVTVAVTFAVSVDPDALVDFETYTGTYAMTNYAAGGVTWTMTNAYAGNTTDDRKNGTKAARLENNRGGEGNPARMTSTAFGQPVTKITFWYANYGANDGGKFKVQVSDDGAAWQDVGDAEYDPITNAALEKATIDTIPASMTYVQFITTAGSAQRVNVDDVGIFFGVPTFGVSVDKSSGFTVNEGSSDTITATAANGTPAYSYSWSSTLGSSYRTTNGNLFTILSTAPTGSYSATVTATDSTLATAQKTVTFSVVGLAPGQPAVVISGSQSGSVGVEMILAITVTNETANDWEIILKDPDGLDADWDYSNFPPTFSLTPAKTGTYVLTATALTGSGNYSNRVNLTVSGGGENSWQIGNEDGGNMFYATSNKSITIVLPTNYTLNAVYGSDTKVGSINGWPWSQVPASNYTWNPGTRTLTLPTSVTNRRIYRIGGTP